MTQVVFTQDDPLKRTAEEAEQAERDANGGRPRKLEPTDAVLNVVRAMARVGCTMEEVAGELGVLRQAFVHFLRDYAAAREAWEIGSMRGKSSLRRVQYEAAIGGDTTMMIWLGKNWLKQSDRVQVAVNPLDENAEPPKDQAEAAERYAGLIDLPPALRLIAPPPDLELEANNVTEVKAEAEMPPTDDGNV